MSEAPKEIHDEILDVFKFIAGSLDDTYKTLEAIRASMETTKPTQVVINREIVGAEPINYLRRLLPTAKPDKDVIDKQIAGFYRVVELNGGYVITRKGRFLDVNGRVSKEKLDVCFYGVNSSDSDLSFSCATQKMNEFINREVETTYAKRLLNWKLSNK
jgi:hypothetical protein